MLTTYENPLSWISAQHDDMCQLLYKWASINSGSYHLEGLERMLMSLKEAFQDLGGQLEILALPPQILFDAYGTAQEQALGKALRLRVRPESQIRVFLGGHMDTVFPVDSAFQEVTKLSEQRWCGPGVTDLKGGLVAMLYALRAFEQSPISERIGYEVLINPDEEIGSPGSQELFTEAAQRCHVGLIFEPSQPDGTLVSARKGSANLRVVARGLSAHVGRAFTEGKSAVVGLAQFIERAHALNTKAVILNVGSIEGGGPVNVVPDHASCLMNVRVESAEIYQDALQQLHELAANCSADIEIFPISYRPPKPFDDATQALFTDIRGCADLLDETLKWQSTGGVCDGNLLAAAGLPTIDTLGVRGGGIHTFDEYIELPSMVARARLTALYLLRLAAGDIHLPGEQHP